VGTGQVQHMLVASAPPPPPPSSLPFRTQQSPPLRNSGLTGGLNAAPRPHTREEKLGCDLRTNKSREEVRSPHARVQAEADKRHAKLRRLPRNRRDAAYECRKSMEPSPCAQSSNATHLRCDTHVGSDGKAQSRADGRAVDRSKDRNGKAADAKKRLIETAHDDRVGTTTVRSPFVEKSEIAPRRKCFPSSSNDDCICFAEVQTVASGPKSIAHFKRECIETRGVIQCQKCGAIHHARGDERIRGMRTEEANKS
jgi:hypothetical protein